ncbi:MAG: hypothetical protein QHI48_07350 [Bacteroidota bacterium]|nr:hypothetical protein [Bacteroidota bacterium]
MKLRLFLIACVITFAEVSAQDVRARLHSDSTHILIGDWVPAKLRVQAPKSWNITLPERGEDVVSGEIVSAQPAVKRDSGESVLFERDYILTSFDTGQTAVRLRVKYSIPGDTMISTVETNPLVLRVVGIPVDTSKPYRDIKDVLRIPITLWEVLVYLAVAAVVILAGVRLRRSFHYMPKRPVECVVEPEEPPIPPYEWAMDRLRELEEKQLWRSGRHKDYQTELSYIIRGYIERRYGLSALEQTTDEIMSGLAFVGLDAALLLSLEQVFRIADMTKFARYMPSDAEHLIGMSVARTFLERTRTAVAEEQYAEIAHA